jgi:lipoprotein antigen
VRELFRTSVALCAAVLVAAVAGCGSAEDGPNSLTIDGKTQRLTGEVMCSDHSAGFAITVKGDGGKGDPAFVHLRSVTHDVESVDLLDADGAELVAADGAKVTHDGDAYTITGDAVPADHSVHAEPKPFTLKVTCSAG